MTDYRFRGRNVEELTRDEFIMPVKWLMERLEQKRNNPLDALRGIWTDDEP